MINENYRLQLLSHPNIFETREDAIEYITDNFKGKALFSEPALFFYGTAREPKMILAVGATTDPTKPRLCLIDDEELREKINEVKDTVDGISDTTESVAADLMNTIEVLGLTYDDNKMTNKVSYDPDSRDELIRDAQTVCEAISIISQYVQEKFSETELSVEDTDSTALTLENSNGLTLKSDVKISTNGDDDSVDFNDNIIGIKSDGIYAAVNLEYDPETNKLTFTTSGVNASGRFKNDAKKVVIDLGAHSIYEADNDGHNVELTFVQGGNNPSKVSADVRISNAQNNILVSQDNKLYVNGDASNIKFNNTNVENALNTLNDAVANIDDNLEFDGADTDTASLTVVKRQNGGWTLSSDVKLSEDRSVIVSEGGLSANIDIDVNATTNKLIFTIGDTTKELELPGVTFIDRIEYDTDNKQIKIYVNGQTEPITIPLENILETWVINNPASSPVVMHREEVSATGNPDVVYATLKVRSTNNLLQVNSQNGELYVDSNELDERFDIEATARQNTDNALSQRIDTLSGEVGSIDTAVNSMLDDITDIERNITTMSTTLSNTVTGLQSEISTRNGQYEEISENIADLNDDIQDINTSLTHKIENVALTKNTDRLYTITVDGSSIGTIEIPEDKYLESVTYDSVSHKLRFIFHTESGTATTDIDLSDIVSTYTAGNGLNLNGNEFSIKLHEDTEAYLQLSANGLRLTGIDNALSQKANTDDVYTKTQSDEKFATLVQFSNLEDTVGQVDAKADTKANASDVYTKTAADEKFATITSLGDYATTAQLSTLEGTVDDLSDTVGTKANTNDVYTKTAADEKFIAQTQVTDSDTVDMTFSNSELKADVKLASGTNLLFVGVDGLKSYVNLVFDSEHKTLTLDRGGENEPVEVDLSSLLDNSVAGVQRAFYDSSTNEIVVEYIVNGVPGVREVRVPVQVASVDVENPLNSPVVLTMTGNQEKLLSADMNLSSNARNGIVKDGNSLYMSKHADDLTAHWGTNQNEVLQTVIDNLKTTVDNLNASLTTLTSTVNTLISRVEQLEAQSGDLSAIEARLDAVEKFHENFIDFSDVDGDGTPDYFDGPGE